MLFRSLAYGTDALARVPGLRMTGTASDKASVLAFVFDGVHPHDIGTILDREGVAIRTGHHCCQPLMDRLGVPATARASLALYNTREEIDVLTHALDKVRVVFVLTPVNRICRTSTRKSSSITTNARTTFVRLRTAGRPRATTRSAAIA